MPIYRTCPNCGSNLDPDERCDCQQEKRRAEEQHGERGGERVGRYVAAAGGEVPRWGDRAVRVG